MSGSVVSAYKDEIRVGYQSPYHPLLSDFLLLYGHHTASSSVAVVHAVSLSYVCVIRRSTLPRQIRSRITVVCAEVCFYYYTGYIAIDNRPSASVSN